MKKKFLTIALTLIMAICVAPISSVRATTTSNVVLPEGVNWTEGTTVYYNGEYYNTLKDALTAVYMSSPTDVAKVYCKPGANVGTMQHSHVADDLIIYGNDAFVSGDTGEYDIEVDTWKYSRKTGEQSSDGEYLTKDITIKAYNLGGISVWGQRHTKYTVNVLFENCKNIHKMYISGTSGTNNYTINNCTFDSNKGSNKNTSIYTNAPGNIFVKDTTFTNIALGINLNNKSNGTQNISLVNCQFNNCAGVDLSANVGSTTYGAPVRIVAQKNATSNLALDTVAFNYSNDFKVIEQNGDILIGDGRSGKDTPGSILVDIKNTTAKLSHQAPNFYDANGNTNPALCDIKEFDDSKHVILSADNKIIVNCAHKTVSLHNAKEATCTSEGYTGDIVCDKCNAVITKGEPIKKLDHNYVDGKCSICGTADSNQKNPPSVDNPADNTVQTGDEARLSLLIALLALAITSFALLSKTRKNAK